MAAWQAPTSLLRNRFGTGVSGHVTGGADALQVTPDLAYCGRLELGELPALLAAYSYHFNVDLELRFTAPGPRRRGWLVNKVGIVYLEIAHLSRVSVATDAEHGWMKQTHDGGLSATRCRRQ